MIARRWISRAQRDQLTGVGIGGFALVELMVAAAVFAVVFLMIATLFARATTDFSGTRLLTATMLAQTAMEDALHSKSVESGTWSTTANRVQWEIVRETNELRDGLWTIQITVNRQSDGKTYAMLWTQAYRAQP